MSDGPSGSLPYTQWTVANRSTSEAFRYRFTSRGPVTDVRATVAHEGRPAADPQLIKIQGRGGRLAEVRILPRESWTYPVTITLWTDD